MIFGQLFTVPVMGCLQESTLIVSFPIFYLFTIDIFLQLLTVFFMKCGMMLVLLFWSLAASGLSQQDSLVSYDNLVFDSDHERERFDLLLEGKTDYFDLFSCLGAPPPGDVYQNKLSFEALVDDLRRLGLEKKKAAKRIKVIYDQVHQKFFRTYEQENHFNDIFKTGAYNCVSATALYAMVFDKMAIPYVIKEKPTHVYLVAYPNTEGIIVEATDPAQGYFVYNDSFRKTFVERMTKGKMINPDDARTMSTDQLFNKYFYRDENINLRQLAGVQYYNDGIYLFGKEQYLHAFNQLAKSHFLYPHDRTAYSMLLAASNYISTLKNSDKAYVDFIPTYAIFSRFGVTSDEIKGEFVNMTNVWLFQKNDTATYNEIYQKFMNIYPDSIYRHEIDFIYNYETARYLVQLGRKTKALEMIGKAYKANPDNVQGQAFFIELIQEKASRINSPERVMTLLETYKEKHPQIINNMSFVNMVMSNYLQMAHKAFYEGKAVMGEQYLEKFEKLYDEVEDVDISDNVIGVSYGSGGMCYFKQGSKARAREILKRGLRLSPGNRILETRLQYIK